VGVSATVFTSLANLGAVVIIFDAVVALGWRCMGVLGQTVIGAGDVPAASVSNNVAFAFCG
jgi:hypothetical protein